MISIAVFIGTRPEAIKLAPVINAIRRQKDMSCTVVSTGQHKEMLESALADFGLTVDYSLEVMRPNQTLSSLTSILFKEIDSALSKKDFDWVVIQGDTTTVMVAAMSAFYRKIKVAHVEAGLRSYDIWAPFPEEVNRKVAGIVSTLHFAPTVGAAENLVNEGVAQDRIQVTGNTGIDSLMLTCESFEESLPEIEMDIKDFTKKFPKYILITGHRRENFGQGFKDICSAILNLADDNPDVGFLYPVHLNPNVRDVVIAMLAEKRNVHLASPQNYRTFVSLMKNCYFILSDSGGVQEEAPSLGKPVLVMRDVTERKESIAAGCSELVGSSADNIFKRATALIQDTDLYTRMSTAQNPYGDGNASNKIVAAIRAYKQ
jgi:UDP-N-acetylglucosamine 2-epimerase (non-hydrolysing)